jgi:hypothetical protein
MRLSIRIAVVAVLAVADLLRGQAAEAPVGVLLGIRLGASSDDPAEYSVPSRYRTLWIVKTGGNVRLVSSADLLIVPRPDGFWRIGGVESRFSESYSEELIWVSNRVDQSVRTSDEASGCRGRSFAQVEFVAGEYLAYSGGSKSNCGDQDNDWFSPSVGRMTELQGHAFGIGPGTVPISEPFGQRGIEALARAAQALNRRRDRADNDAEPDAGPWEPFDTEWGLRWESTTLSVFGYGKRSRDFGFFARLPLSPLEATFGRHSRPLAPRALTSVAADATGAFLSPVGGLLVVATPREVLAFAASSPPFGNPALRIDIGAYPDSRERTGWGAPRGTAPVMAEWATGQDVATWTNAVRNLGRQPIPKVLVEKSVAFEAK